MSNEPPSRAGKPPPGGPAPRDRRGQHRAAIEIPAILRLGTREVACTVRDLSVQGIALKMSESVAPEMVVRVIFRLPNARQPVDVACLPALSEGGRQAGIVGLRFVELDQEAARTIATFVQRNRSDRPFSGGRQAHAAPGAGGTDDPAEALEDLYRRAMDEVDEKSVRRGGLLARWRRRDR